MRNSLFKLRTMVYKRPFWIIRLTFHSWLLYFCQRAVYFYHTHKAIYGVSDNILLLHTHVALNGLSHKKLIIQYDLDYYFTCMNLDIIIFPWAFFKFIQIQHLRLCLNTIVKYPELSTWNMNLTETSWENYVWNSKIPIFVTKHIYLVWISIYPYILCVYIRLYLFDSIMHNTNIHALHINVNAFLKLRILTNS